MITKDWTPELIDAECASSHRAYDDALAEHYTDYFRFHPDEAGSQPWSASSLEAALPKGWAKLAAEIPTTLRHGQCLSGKSSQTLVLGLLGVPASLEPDLGWLWRALGVPPSPDPAPQVRFERTLPNKLLGEHPRATSLDCLIEADDVVVCVEAKLREDGVGACSCPDPGTRCSERVLGRGAYRQAARNDMAMGWPGQGPCQLRPAYQAVRTVAAAKALAGVDRRAVVGMLYDERNPYFKRTGNWPGWPALLTERLAASKRVEFGAVSWQSLVPELPLDEPTCYWARHKHGLAAAGDP